MERSRKESRKPGSVVSDHQSRPGGAFAHCDSYDESIRQSRKTIKMDPNFALAHNQLGQAYLQKQMNEDAITELQKAVQLSAGQPNLPG
jgi:tetratricopeptide (TPR) repeat protein